MSEYKPLKEYEIVPGMIFENNFGSKIIIQLISADYITYSEYSYNETGKPFTNTVPVDFCTANAKLIYDPRKGNNMSIQEQIEEHKKKIKILENQLQEETLKNIFVPNNVYKIKRRNVSDTILAKFHKFSCDNLYIIYFPEYGRQEEMLLSGIEKVWKIDIVYDLFFFNKPIFERY